MTPKKTFVNLSLAVLVLFGLLGLSALARGGVLQPDDIFKINAAAESQLSPDGRWVAFTVRIPRASGDAAGEDYRELHVVNARSGESRPFIKGKVNIQSPRFSPDGRMIAYLAERVEKAKKQVWVIPLDGGESFQVTKSKSNVVHFEWHPDSKQIAYVATTPPSETEEKLKEKGYGFVYYEENLKDRELFMIPVDPTGAGAKAEPRKLMEKGSVWSIEFSPDGKTLALGVSTANLIDQSYVFQRIALLDVASGEEKTLVAEANKLGNVAFSPDGKRLAYAAALHRNDHAVSQAYVVDVSGGTPRNLTPPSFKGHVDWVGWKDNSTVVYRAGEGVWNSLNLVGLDGKKRKQVLHSRDSGVIFGTPTHTRDFKTVAFIGSTPEVPNEIYGWSPGKQPKRLTNLNPWLSEKDLGRVEIVRYPARDGLEIEGLLYYPVDYTEGTRYPLIVEVHGGPESHYSNGWQTGYSSPVHVLAGKGYAVFLPNYRSSTGYGVEVANSTLGDPAGKEFDDIADGIDYLVERGIADRERVGLGGGSYGGYAAAWFSSYYTKYVRAVCMFVGISNLISKRGTTDIPYEELFVHSGKKLEEMWDLSLKRSPVYYAHQSKTAVLIYGGAADTRVSPTQSVEYYRALKMNDHPAVRLVQYPGEPHGNQKQPGRIDVLHRTLRWYDWYVMDKKPLDGPMPPLDISDTYGLELKTEKKEEPLP